MSEEFSPTEISEAIDAVDAGRRAKAYGGLESSPEQGAEALQLADATGAPAEYIHSDLQGFKDNHKKSLVGQILEAEPTIADYIKENPLAEVVSGNDYGNLHTFLSTIPGDELGHSIARAINKGIYGGAVGAAKGAIEGLASPMSEEDSENYAAAPWGLKAQALGLDAGRRVLEAFSGAIMGGATGAIRAGAESLGVRETEVGQLERDVYTELESLMGHGPEYTRALAEKAGLGAIADQAAQRQAFHDFSEAQVIGLNSARRWIGEEVVPPKGINPEIDSHLATANEKLLGALNENLNAAQESQTKELHPEYFQKLAEKRYGSSVMGINGNAVLELYGDKLPSPDDGLLGWVPGIEDQLALAKLTGEDIHVPMAAWIAHVDPAVAKTLHDDTRVWEGGITANETKEPIEPRDIIDDALAHSRAASGTEPMFSFGDRKIKLQNVPAFKGSEEFHEFKILDEKNKPIGELSILPDPEKKELYVANINGLAGLFSNSFGPRLILDLKRQLKTMYPDYEYITGHRVSGAREKAGTWESEVAYPRVKLSVMDMSDYDGFKSLLQEKFIDGAVHDFGMGVLAERLPFMDMSDTMQSAIRIVDEELNRITGGKAKFQPVTNITKEGVPLDKFIEGASFRGKVLVDMFGPDALGTARHESVHWLREHEFFKEGEWEALVQAAEDNGWLEKYEIDKNYGHLPKDVQYEEAIAEAFRGWAKTKDATPKGKIGKIFQRLADLWNRIQERFGKEGLTAEGLFNQIHSGDLVKRNWAASDAKQIKSDLGQDIRGIKLRAEENPNGDIINVWHGSPHKFTKFDNSKIGSGEGAQVYGWGTYHAERRSIAQSYADKLSKNADVDFEYKGREYHGDEIDDILNELGDNAPGAYKGITALIENSFDKDIALEDIQHQLDNYQGWNDLFTDAEIEKRLAFFTADGIVTPEIIKAERERYDAWDRDNIKELKAALDWVKNNHADVTAPTKAVEPQLYKVRILSHPDKFLDWDAPFNGQSQYVQDILTKLGIKDYTSTGWENKGENFYQQVAKLESDKMASLFLNHHGIAGIKYFDRPSRSSKTGTRNFVVFNDQDLQITHVNDNVVGGPKLSIRDTVRQQLDHIRPAVVGLDKKSFENLEKSIQARHAEDQAKWFKRYEAKQRKVQSKEWREETKQLKINVEAEVRARPDVLADLFIGRGELPGGEKIKQVVPLAIDKVGEELRAKLPRRYFSKDGLDPDLVGGMFGYTSGDAMIQHLIEYNSDRGNMTSQEHLDAVIKAETDRRMLQKFGTLDENVMRDALDATISKTTLNVLADEWAGAAMQHGITVDKVAAKNEVLESFDKKIISGISSAKMRTGMLGLYDKATKALINHDPAAAIKFLQQRYALGVAAAEAVKFEKSFAKFNRLAKKYKKRAPAGTEGEFTNYIHDILYRVGVKVNRSAADIAKEISESASGSLKDFVDRERSMGRELDVWDQLFDPTWEKKLSQLTAEEFKLLHDSLHSLDFASREENKIYSQGEAIAKAELKERLIAGIRDSVGAKLREPKNPTVIKNFYVGSLSMENILNRWDGFDSKGPWNQYIMRDLIEGANQEDAWKKEYAAQFKQLKSPSNLGKSIDNRLFRDQDHGVLMKFTRRNLIAVMLNMGGGREKKSNLFKLAKGYDLDVDQIVKWVNDHATKEDWDFVQGVWDIFGDLKQRGDIMYRHLNGGVAPKDKPVVPVNTKFGVIRGGYYPIIYDLRQTGVPSGVLGNGPLEHENYIRATTPNGWTKEVTSATGPLLLEMDQIPSRIASEIHDIALRPAIVNASKIFYDKDILSAIRKYYGDEYRDQMQPYLRAVANSANDMSNAQRQLVGFEETLRLNMVSSLIGINPGTPIKHGLSALLTSIRQVGAKDFAREVAGMFRYDPIIGESNWQFAMKNSLELQRRERNIEETIYGATTGVLTPGDKFSSMRETFIHYGSMPVALSDKLSSVPTWLAAYKKEMAKSGIHGDAVYEADRAVRFAHGSTAITNRTRLMRELNPWLTSVYNFFSDILNRQMQTIWEAGKIEGLVKDENYGAAMKAAGAFGTGLFVYLVWPAIVEQMVAGEEHDKDESWAAWGAKALVHTEGSSWPIVREFTNAIMTGHDPQYGLTGTTMKSLTLAIKDLGKDHPFAKENRGKLIQDAGALLGALTGFPLAVFKEARYAHDVEYHQTPQPKGPWAWLMGARFGTTKGHSATFSDWQKGKVQK